VKLSVGELSGAGSVEANGGTVIVWNTGDGGGGRVAVLYTTNLGFNFANITARGGTSSYMGGVGTVFIKQADQAHGELVLATNLSNPGVLPGLPTPVPGGSYDRFAATGQAKVSLSSGLTAKRATFGAGTVTIPGDLTVDEVSFTGGGTLNLAGAFSTQQVGTLSIGTHVTFGAFSAPNVTGLTVDNAAVSFTTPWPLNMGIPLMVKGGYGVLSLWGEQVVQLDSLSLTESGKLTHAAATTTQQHRIDLDVAKDIFISYGSSIDVSVKGYLGGPISSDPVAARGRTVLVDADGVKRRNVPTLVNDACGSYGGYGWAPSGATPVEVYGDLRDPDDLGSGGSANHNTIGGTGGGLVRLKANKLVLDGTVLANAGPNGYRSGAGGGVKLDVGELSGIGSVEAIGEHYDCGGGGRIAVYYTKNTGFDLGKLRAATGGYGYGGAGTVFTKGADQLYGELVVNDWSGNTATAKATPVPGGRYDRFVVTGGAVASLSGGLVARNAVFAGVSVTHIPGDLTVEEQVTFSGGGTLNLSGAFTTLQTGALSLGTSVSFTSFSAPNVTELTVSGASVVFNQPWPLPMDIPLTVTGSGASLSLWGEERVRLSKLTLSGGGRLTHAAATLTEQHRLELEVTGEVSIDGNSSIDVSGKGYLGGPKTADLVAARGRTVLVDASGVKQRNVPAPVDKAAGSHGGYGYSVGAAAPVYGDLRDPNDLGSGGAGNQNYVGGAGGGLVRLKANKLVLNGTIKANGVGSSAYSGSGGGVKLDVGELSGSGSAEASGNGSAGGGRIALFYASNQGFDVNKLSARSLGSGGSAGAGTVFAKGATQAHGELLVVNHYISTLDTVPPTPVPGGSYDRLWLGDGAWTSISSGVVANRVTFGPNSRTSIPGDLTVGELVAFDGGTLSLAGAFSTPQAGLLNIGTNVTFGAFSAPNVTGLTVTNAAVSFTQPWALKQNIPLTVTGSSALLSLWGEQPLKLSTLSLKSGGKLTHAPATLAQAHRLDLDVAGDVLIESNSSIDVSGKGYLGGPKSANPVVARGRTVVVDADGVKQRNVPALVDNASGSYGGYGYMTTTPAEVYGDFRDPDDVGGGGAGNATYAGGAGGGLVRIKANNLVLNGTIKANGVNVSALDGAGGGVKLEVATLSGSGSVEADGGGDGGGGRVAVLYGTGQGTVLTKLYARANSHGGGAGTVFSKSASQAHGELIVNNGTPNTLSTAKATPVAAGTYDRLVVNGNAKARFLGDIHANTLELSGPGLVEPAGAVSAGNAALLDIGTSVTFGAFSAPNATGLKVTGAAVSFTQPWPLQQNIPVTVMGNYSALSLWGEQPLKLSTLTIKSGAQLTHAAATDTQMHRLELDVAGQVLIESGGSIDVSGKGLPGGPKSADPVVARGRTVLVDSAGVKQRNVPALVDNAAGSYGGHGAAAGTPLDVYGDFRDPDEPGSGGAGNTNYVGGAGGGLVRLKANSLVLNGTIRANAINASYSRDGSGGGVKVQVTTLSGSGSMEALGYAEGGGGRVAVLYDTNNGFNLSNLYAWTSSDGGAGTVFTKSASQAFGELTVDNRDTYYANGAKATPVPAGSYDRLTVKGQTKVRFMGDVHAKVLDLSEGKGTVEFGGALSIENSGPMTIGTSMTFGNFSAPNLTALTVSNAAVSFTQPWPLSDGVALTVTGSNGLLSLWGEQQVKLSSLSLKSSGKLTHAAATETQTHRLDLDVSGEVLIESSCSIDVSGKGFLGGPKSTDPVVARGRTVLVDSSGVKQRNVPALVDNACGSHGGHGSAAGAPMDVYGNVSDPDELGSGGAGNQYHPGGAGGGLVRLKANSLVLNGTVKANGGYSSNRSGAGGGVKLEVGTLSGTGSVEATGNGEAGGGRIAVLYGTNSGFNLTKLSVHSSSINGGAGTAFIRKTTAPTSTELVVDNSQTYTLSNARATPVPAGTYDRLAVKGRAKVLALGDITTTTLDLATGGAEFPGALSISGTGELVLGANTTFSGPVSALNLTDLTVSGASTLVRFAQPWSMRSDLRLSVKDSSTLVLSGNVVVPLGRLTLSESAVLTHEATTTTQTHKLDLAVSGDVTIATNAKIDVTGKGYLGGNSGDNLQMAGRTQGNMSVADVSGSYGGYGYSAWTSASTVPMATYGDFRNPNELGSGGAANSSGYGGNGGGLVRISGSTFTLHGKILANGSSGTGTNPRGGSGGGVWLDVVTLAGAGEIQARGPNYSGGGGRIAVLYDQISTASPFDLGNKLSANATAAGSGAGTVYTRKMAGTDAQAYGTLRVDNADVNASTWATPLEDPTGTNVLTLDSLLIRRKAYARTDDTLSVTTLQIDTNAKLDRP
jgi:hypothetical protein